MYSQRKPEFDRKAEEHSSSRISGLKMAYDEAGDKDLSFRTIQDWCKKDIFALKPEERPKCGTQHGRTRVTLSFPTVLSAPPSESEKCPFNNVNCSHLTAHSFGVESQARARSR